MLLDLDVYYLKLNRIVINNINISIDFCLC